MLLRSTFAPISETGFWIATMKFSMVPALLPHLLINRGTTPFVVKNAFTDT